MSANTLFILLPSIVLMIAQGIPGYIVTAVRPFTPVSPYRDGNLPHSLTSDYPIRK